MDYKKYYSLLKNDYEKAECYKASFIPDYLYKFVALDDTSKNELKYKTLENNQIWFNNCEDQNDPFEYKGFIFDEKRAKSFGIVDNEYHIYKKVLDGVDDIFFITALTKKMYNNIPIWAYYANNHKGFCVKYRVTNKMYIDKVIYEEKPISSVNIPIKVIRAIMDTGESGKPLSKEKEILIKLMLFKYVFKHISWKYEDEFRIIYPCSDDQKTGMNIDLKTVGLHLEKIYTGCKCSEQDKIRLANICDDLKIGNLINMKTSETEFIFEEEQII